ncbi:reverse transcriptase domain-containing protein, partial [Tanacetum coccineum]
FGLPKEIISDNGKQFRDNPFRDWCEKLCIQQHFASVKHPQTNGLVKRANRSLGEGIKAKVGKDNKNWLEEISHVLWAHHTMIKSSNGDTPFSLTYETEAVILAEIGMPTFRTTEVDVAEEENTDRVEEQKDDEELNADEEQKGDDQAGDEQLVVLVSTTQKEIPNLLQSTSSHYVSSNFDVPNIQQEPFHSVKVSVIPKTTQIPPTTPPAPPLPATVIPSTQVTNSEALKPVVQRFTELKQAVKELKQADHSTTVLASIRSQVSSVVKEYLGSSLPDAFQRVLQSHTKELKKELFEIRDYKDVIKESVQANVINKVKKFLLKFLPQ